MMNNNLQEKESLVATWDSVSSLYDAQQYLQAPENQANLSMLLNDIGNPAGKTIIEVGCGSGFTSLELAKRGAICTLLDISASALKVACDAFRSAGMNEPKCFHEDALASTVKTDSFDVVWNGGVIEHFYDDGKTQLLQEMIRICKPGGIVIVQVPNRWCFQFQLVQAWEKLRGTWRYGFEDDMSPLRLKRLCKKAGITSPSVYAFNPVLGWRWVWGARRIISALGWETAERHSRRSVFGFLAVLTIRKTTLEAGSQ